MSERQVKDWLEGYLEYTDNTEPPILFRLWTAISVVASVMQRKCSLPWGTLTFYPNMYVILVAPSGKARKGTAMGPGLDMLQDLGIKLAAEATTRESLIRELRNANDSEISPDGTTDFHSSLTIYSPEFTVFLGFQNHQLMADLTDWYDCRSRWVYRTKTQGTDDIIGVWVNILGATTPDLIQTAMPLDAIGGGLTSRMIFVYEPTKAKRVELPLLSQEAKALRDKLVIDLESMKMLRGEFKVTDDFLDRWIAFYKNADEHPPFEDTRFAGYIERRPTHAMKLSMIVNASRGTSMILNKDDLNRAIEILKATEQKMLQTFGGVGKSGTADVMHRLMEVVALKRKMLFSELMAMFYHDVDKYTLEKILQTLESMKYLKTTMGDPKGLIIEYRPKEDDKENKEDNEDVEL